MLPFVEILDNKGESHFVRALLESGSEVSIISEEVVEQMQLLKEKTDIKLEGLGLKQLKSKNLVASVCFKLKDGSNMKFNLNCDRKSN